VKLMVRHSILLLLAAIAPSAAAQDVTVKLGTLAPAGSTWHNLLKDMGEQWNQASGGKVKVKVYPGGILGDEADMVRKMSVGQLQAATLSAVGMHDIIRESHALSTPMMIESNEELDYVLPKIQGKLEQLLEKKGYVALQWIQVGQVRFFCTKGHATPAEMGEHKLFAWDSDPGTVKMWKAAGFKPITLSATDLMASLQTGMVSCVPGPPLYLFTARIFEKANHMIDVPWGLVIGATLVQKKVWEKVPAELRPKLLEIARALGEKSEAEVRRMNVEAVDSMKKSGLTVVTPSDMGLWRKAAEATWPVMRGGVVPAEFFDEVKKARDEFRARKK
jgi:TRAP-type transport system periplasmic protein